MENNFSENTLFSSTLKVEENKVSSENSNFASRYHFRTFQIYIETVKDMPSGDVQCPSKNGHLGFYFLAREL